MLEPGPYLAGELDRSDSGIRRNGHGPDDDVGEAQVAEDGQLLGDRVGVAVRDGGPIEAAVAGIAISSSPTLSASAVVSATKTSLRIGMRTGSRPCRAQASR